MNFKEEENTQDAEKNKVFDREQSEEFKIMTRRGKICIHIYICPKYNVNNAAEYSLLYSLSK